MFQTQRIILLFVIASMAMGDAMSAEQVEKTPGAPTPQVQAEKKNTYSAYKGLKLTVVNDTWKEECSACHIAYAPGLLQAESWLKIMQTLKEHFGVDASLSTEESREITEFLVSNASIRWRYPQAPLRISETLWFKKNHSLHDGFWKDPKIKGAYNCPACHKNSDQGDFYGDGGGCGGASGCHTFKGSLTR